MCWLHVLYHHLNACDPGGTAKNVAAWGAPAGEGVGQIELGPSAVARVSHISREI